jgi:hypothetical protein
MIMIYIQIYDRRKRIKANGNSTVDLPATALISKIALVFLGTHYFFQLYGKKAAAGEQPSAVADACNKIRIKKQKKNMINHDTSHFVE